MENNKKRIIIIGGGMAGVGAARWLIDNDINHNLDIVILEARDRVGGRIHTTFDYNCPIDLGAAWVHNYGPDNPISIMADHLKLNIKKSNDDSGEVYDLQGKQYGDIQTLRTWELMEKVLGKSVKSVQGKITDQSLEDVIFSKVSPQQWADPVFQCWFAILDFELGCPISHVSPAAICSDWMDAIDGDEEDCDMVFRDTGYVGVLNALLTGRATDNLIMRPRVLDTSQQMELPHMVPINVLLNQCVEAINISPTSAPVSVIVQDTSDGSQKCYEADRVIVTVPLGVLKSGSIDFIPPLSDSKQHAISTAGFGNVVKIVLEFDKVFWSSQTEFLAIADRSLCSPHPKDAPCDSPHLRGLCTHFWNMFPYNGKKILICFGLGDAAYMIDQMSDEELLELLLTRLKCLEKHSKMKTKFKDMVSTSFSEEFYDRYRPTRWMRTHWADDPYARGVYSHVTKGLSPDASFSVWEELGRPENEYLWFAGEATMTSSLARSTVHGAWLSGVRVAENVARSLDLPIYTPGYNSFHFPPAKK